MHGDCWSQDRGQALFIFLVFNMSNQGMGWVQPLTRGRDFAESRGCWRPEFAQKLLLLIPFSAEGIEVRFVKGAQSTWEYLQCSEHWPQVCRLFLLIRGWFDLPYLILSYKIHIPQAKKIELAMEATGQRLNSEAKERRNLSRGQRNVKTRHPTGDLDHIQVDVEGKEGTEQTLQRDQFLIWKLLNFFTLAKSRIFHWTSFLGLL